MGIVSHLDIKKINKIYLIYGAIYSIPIALFTYFFKYIYFIVIKQYSIKITQKNELLNNISINDIIGAISYGPILENLLFICLPIFLIKKLLPIKNIYFLALPPSLIAWLLHDFSLFGFPHAVSFYFYAFFFLHTKNTYNFATAFTSITICHAFANIIRIIISAYLPYNIQFIP